MTLLRFPAPPASPLLTRVPLSDIELPVLDDLPWPWPGRLLHVDEPSGNTTLTVHVRDTPGHPNAQRAVYLHGLGGSATNWTELAGLLAGEATGLSVDLPGFGLSPPRDDRDFSMSTQADTVAAIIARTGEGPVHLFGNSMGGAIALLLAAGRPDLVSSLTLISPAMPDLRPDLSRMSDPRMALALLPLIGRPARRGLAALTARERTVQLLNLCFADPTRVSAARFDLAVAEYAERMAMPWSSNVLGPAVAAIVRDWLAPPARSLWAVAHRVLAPTLVIWGEGDRVISVRKAARTARMLRRGRLLVLPRTGHAAQMERPTTVAKAVLGMWHAVEQGAW
ncbi:MAG TPA: alpha/beta fold hydrolase [Pseudonocardiaceae bacterium]|jgi:pimeloyl-ACP methyl ester carboxylesterase|nr:alpha/beta fold hydrolase [Pseudonocardiaceae bacterium]